MIGVRLPMGRFTSAGNHHAWATAARTVLRFDGGGQMHGERHRADDPVGVIHETDEVARRRFPDQIDDALEAGVPVTRFAALRERDSPLKMVDHRLVRRRIPPFGGEIIFSARHENPIMLRKAAVGPGRRRGLLLGR